VKVFCVGCGKTGTTSLAAALGGLGFRVGDQHRAEVTIDDWVRRDFRRIIDYCADADAFQDIPFSLEDTFRALDEAYPGARFVLSVRGSSDEWYRSLVAFHTKIFDLGRLPTPDDLKAFAYIEPGWIWRAHQAIYGCDESSLFRRDLYVAHYERHTAAVIRYFARRPDDLLVLNVSQPGAMDRLCRHVGSPLRGLEMPHLNASRAA
jgi:hypothetical protein